MLKNIFKTAMAPSATVAFRKQPLQSTLTEVKTKHDSSVFELHIRPSFDFKQAILAMGANVEVLEPQSLRDEIKSILTDMMQKYV